MMAAHKEMPIKKRLIGAVLSRGFTLSQAPLTATESIALECLKQIASEGRIADQYEICAGVGSENSNGGTVAGIIRRLVEKGYVEHVLGHPLQKAIWLRIIATGQCTAEPRNKVRHWRHRTESCPAPAIHSVAQTSKPLARMIEDTARNLGRPLAEFLMDCVYVGFNEINGETDG